jgi:hypothetical protein
MPYTPRAVTEMEYPDPMPGGTRHCAHTHATVHHQQARRALSRGRAAPTATAPASRPTPHPNQFPITGVVHVGEVALLPKRRRGARQYCVTLHKLHGATVLEVAAGNLQQGAASRGGRQRGNGRVRRRLHNLAAPHKQIAPKQQQFRRMRGKTARGHGSPQQKTHL